MEELESLQEASDVIEIPHEISPEGVMSFMESGLGYRWTIISRDPYLVSHGSQEQGTYGEVALIENNLLVWGGDIFVNRIRHLLDMMRKTERRG